MGDVSGGLPIGDVLVPDGDGAVLYFDTETTGTEATDRVCEIGAVLWRGGRSVGRFHSYVRPGIPVNPEAIRVHGLTDEFLADAPSMEEVWPRFLEFVGGRTLHAHNAAFDRRLTRQSLTTPWEPPMVCTLRLARGVLGSTVPCGIDALLKRFGVGKTRGKHSAVEDCELLACVVDELTAQHNLLPESHTTGISDHPVQPRHHVWNVPHRTYPPTTPTTAEP